MGAAVVRYSEQEVTDHAAMLLFHTEHGVGFVLHRFSV